MYNVSDSIRKKDSAGGGLVLLLNFWIKETTHTRTGHNKM
jgi:hypothetical protein